MLSLSADMNKLSIDLKLVNGEQSAESGDLPFSLELMNYAEAIARRDEEEDLGVARQALRQAAGDEVVVDAAAVAANFQRMVRIADSTGIALDSFQEEMSADVRQELDLDRLR